MRLLSGTRRRVRALRRRLSPALVAAARRAARLSEALGPAAHSLRTRIIVAFAALLALALVNIVVVQRGARQSMVAFEQVQQAIERQTAIVEAIHRIEDQRRELQVRATILGVDDRADAAVRDRAGARADEISARLARVAELVEPAEQAAFVRTLERTERLSELWSTFYASVGVDPVRASEIVPAAEEAARALAEDELPAALDRERDRLERARTAFEAADRTARRTAWLIFLISAALGALVAAVTSRDLLRSIAALRLGADKIGQGDLDHRIPLRGGDELADVADSFNTMAARLRERSAEIEEQKKISESLLLNILPRQVAQELRRAGRVEPKYLPDATIMFADLVGFTRLFDTLSVGRMVRLLDDLFTDFDRIVRLYRLEKLKTVGDAYVSVGGLSREGSSHPIDSVMAAFDIVEAVRRRGRRERLPLAVRIGIHTGPVAAGVVGIEKFAFDVWGETVNFAARLEEASEPGRVNISSGTYLRVKDFFSCEDRGRIETKEKRAFDMYFVDGVHPEIAGSGNPPPEFRERYRAYFDEAPSAYPESLAGA